MSELIRREDAINAVEMFFKDAYIEDADVHCTDMVYEINHIPTASQWHRVEDGLPMNKQNLLFVVHTPPYHHTELGEMPDTKKVVYGLFDPKPRYGRRYWSFEDEIGECVIINEYVKEYCGEETYITHWMPLPEPPQEDA